MRLAANVNQAASKPIVSWLALEKALAGLDSEDQIAARVVELRQFAGLGHEEIAAEFCISYVIRARIAPAPGLAPGWPRDLSFLEILRQVRPRTTHATMTSKCGASPAE
jgi:hypothetical protein